MSDYRKLVCITLVILLPCSVASQSQGIAILHATGTVTVNGNSIPTSSALFENDYIETKFDGEAKIDLPGSTAIIGPNSRTQLEATELFLDRGSVQVTSTNQFPVRVGCITATPATQGWTQYEVVHPDGKMTVFAHKSDVDIEARKKAFDTKSKDGRPEHVTVREGEQATREDKCLAAERPVEADKAWLNRPPAVAAGTLIVVGIICFALCRCNPVSPSKPRDCDW